MKLTNSFIKYWIFNLLLFCLLLGSPNLLKADKTDSFQADVEDLNFNIKLCLNGEKGKLFREVIKLFVQNEGLSTLFDKESGLADTFSSNEEKYNHLFQICLLSASQFKCHLSKIIAKVDEACLSEFEKTALNSESIALLRAINKKLFNTKLDYSVSSETQPDLLKNAVKATYEAVIQKRGTWKSLRNNDKQKQMKIFSDVLMKELWEEIDSLVQAKIDSYLILNRRDEFNEKHERSFESFRVDCLARIYLLKTYYQTKGVIADKLLEFTDRHLTYSNLSEFLSEFVGIWDSSQSAFRNDEEKKEFISKKVTEHFFLNEDLVYVQNQIHVQTMRIYEKNLNDFKISVNSEIEASELKAQKKEKEVPKIDIEKKVHANEVGGQVLEAIGAVTTVGGVLVATGLIAVPETGPVGLVVVVVGILIELGQLIYDNSLGEEAEHKHLFQIKQNISDPILADKKRLTRLWEIFSENFHPNAIR